MKKIGQTDTGDILLECTAREFDQLRRLENTSQGIAYWGGFADSDRPYVFTGDFVKAFEAIGEWVGLKQRVNHLKLAVEKVDEILYGRTK